MSLPGFRRHRRRQGNAVTAVRLALDTAGFTYRKWRGDQRCKPGDWLVDNAGDVYTVDATVFERTYQPSAPSQYVKVAPIWARVADTPGIVTTREGASKFERGDYLVCNSEDGDNCYCMTAQKFESLYELDV
jgi:hypothetical protein